MKIWIGVTDKNWFEYLSRLDPDEVNFWQPSGSQSFRAETAGEPFLFKLHSPDNYIVGGGHFVRYSALPASLAWDAFERKNGGASFADLRARIRRYRNVETTLDPIIGCNVLAGLSSCLATNEYPLPTTGPPTSSGARLTTRQQKRVNV